MIATITRAECKDCIAQTGAEVEEDYISNHKLSGPHELQADDNAAIFDKVARLLEEDRGVACEAHYFAEEVDAD